MHIANQIPKVLFAILYMSAPIDDNYLCECVRHRLNETINKHSFKAVFHCV